jgi:hypothetical protein
MQDVLEVPDAWKEISWSFKETTRRMKQLHVVLFIKMTEAEVLHSLWYQGWLQSR